ncbi:hypothetical protein EGJ22_02085 [Pseudomonas sp. p99-361]|nr:hypothetical protein EGJ22_02085 [Pseudomonas sp. p99-361]
MGPSWYCIAHWPGWPNNHRGCFAAHRDTRPRCKSNCLSQKFEKPARFTCGSGHAREAGDAVYGTGFAGVRGHARSHRTV